MNGTSQFPIVGIGASAGGVEALEGFFKGLPPRPDCGVVIVTHLSPERESLLHEVVARYTELPVQVADNGMEVEINSVYVLPADAILSIEKRVLRICKNGSRRERKPIDIFFASLALDLGDLAVGIILSGGDGDGTLGIKAIKEHGGLTLAQTRDGYGPQHLDMPASAISTGFVDLAIPAEEMGGKLADFARGLGVLDGAHAPDANGHTVEEAMPEIYGILRNQIGHDFSGYKIKTFMRRVQRRMQVTQLDTVEAYVEQLRQYPSEVGALFRDLLINVTNFFRDDDAFSSLAAQVVPKLFEGRGAGDTVRVWVPGCSTGEEVFSIAILMREYMEGLDALPRVQLFATDIDERSLSVARAARYPAGLLDSVSLERRERFFVGDGGSYVISKEVREMCIFSPHSVIRDPPFSRVDLVSCRNLLIYFGVDVQNQVIPTFHYALKPNGYLFLGSAENVSQFSDLFEPIEKKQRIFRRRSDVSSSIRIPIMVGALRSGHINDLVPRRPALVGAGLRQAVDEQVIERFAPPHVVVNGEGDTVYYSQRTGKYLEAPAGAPTRQLMSLARKDLRLDLRAMFREAVESGRVVTRDSVAVESDGGVQMVSITIEPLNGRSSDEPLYIVLFADQGPVLSRQEALDRVHATRDGATAHTERELRDTRDRLQSMIEEYETALEELKSSNEELVSVNEEMQSTNEELEASKEELQSVNEELHTVNTELTDKIEALDRANADLQNLFDSSDIGTVFLDRQLAIRSFTPAVNKVFNILPADRGRPITDLSSRLSLPGFAEDIEKVFAGKGSMERRLESDDHTAHYLVRLAPYRDNARKAEGVVITFIDVTNLTLAVARQRLLVAELQHRTRNLLAVVLSIAKQTLGKGGPLADFTTRLGALGRVQSLVANAERDEIMLGDIVRLELEATGAPTDGRIHVSGPPLKLGFDLVQTFGLALHELATNAVKYGALRTETGTLDVSWEVVRGGEGDRLVLDWRESGVTDLREPKRRGFGSEMIERALTFSLQAETTLAFERDGVVCHIELPLPQAANGDGLADRAGQ